MLFAQIVAIATLLGFTLPLGYAFNALLNQVVPMRVSRDGERQGLDLFELGAGAYPDLGAPDDYMPLRSEADDTSEKKQGYRSVLRP